jgi:predicted nucleotidyltransferase component of viral defense system
MEKVLNFKELYQMQDEVLELVFSCNNSFYLTGGTALHRFYYHYRYSNDLDFFCPQTVLFSEFIQEILQKVEYFTYEVQTRDFHRIRFKNYLQVDFVNDRVYREGISKIFGKYKIDNLMNILTNKMTAIIGRDEAKDVFDIVSIAKNENFNWEEILSIANKKEQISVETLIYRLESFPIKWLERIHHCPKTVNINPQDIRIICDDITNKSMNSLVT